MNRTTKHDRSFIQPQGIDPYSCTGSSPTNPNEDASHLPESGSGFLTTANHSKTLTGRVSFEWIGHRGQPVVPILGGISAGSHIASARNNPEPGWWEDFVGRGKPVDTRRTVALGTDYLCSPGTLSGEHGHPVEITTTDQAQVLGEVLDSLGLERVPAIIGSSYGGMVALEFARLYPRRVGRVLVIGAAHRTHPMATAQRDIQRRIIELGAGTEREKDCVILARALAMTTYRSAREFQERFNNALEYLDGAASFPVMRYLESRGRKFAETFDATAFSALSRSIDLHHIDPSDIVVPVDIVAVDSDSLVPPWLVKEFERRAGGPCRVHTVTSRYGHDAFLKEKESIGRIVRSFIDADIPIHRPSCETIGSVTAAVRAGVAADPAHRAVMPPIYLSANYGFETLARRGAYDYSRTANPTRDLLAGILADLEGGSAACVTSTGMSAITAVLQLLEPGATLAAPHDCYGGTRRLFDTMSGKRGITVTYHDMSDRSQLDAAAASHPAMIWIETPSNPLLRVTDLELAGCLTRDSETVLVVDNTFMSPALQNPIRFGADIVIHSTTKFLNGHSDVVGGAIVTRDKAVGEELAWWCNCLGVSGSPFDSFLTLRGVRTLHARIDVHQRNAKEVVNVLGTHPAVRALFYPGLTDHPGHEIARAQQRGFGSLVSFELNGGRREVSGFVESLRFFTLAESLGGVESLVCHPATMTHAAMDSAAQTVAGISDSLVRLSIGIEDPGDLVPDVVAALNASGGEREAGK